MTTTTVRPIDRVLDALGYTGARDGGQYKCTCPTHQDDKESLSVTVTPQGVVLLHCFAKCDSAAIVKAMGLTFVDLSPAKEAKAEKVKRSIVAEYDYTDAMGKRLYQVVRYVPKDFKQRRPGPNGDWVWSLKGVQRVLYELPRLLESDPEQWVYIVEGEKDADNLNRRGLIATTAAQGVDKWEPHFNQWLAGRRVCILPDNDEPGIKHAHNVAAHLLPGAACVRLVELADLPPKGDVSDWLSLGHTVAELDMLVEAATNYIAPLPTAPASHLYTNGKSHDTGATSMLVDHPTHDHGNAEVVEALNPGRFAFCNELGWVRHIGTHWDTQNAEFEVHRAITKALIKRRMAAVEAEREDIVKGTIPNESRKNAVKGMYRDLVAVALREFDNDPNVLNCANGVIDLRSGQLVAHGPSNRFTYCVQTAYDPAADRAPWINFLTGSVGDYSEISDWLQMAFGYSITGLTREECMFYVHGPSRSGKGTFTQAALTLLGSPLARGVDFTTFTRARDGDSQNFDLAPLRPARFISASESGRYASLNEAVVKNITGNDPITAAYKHRDQFTYTPQFKIWLSSNHPAKGDVDDDAFWGRLRVIKFPISHLGNEDKRLKWHMSSPAVLPGVLAWAVEGARQWYASPQGLITPYAVDSATRLQRSELDHVQQWLDECVKPLSGEATTVPTLYASYKTWCDDNGQTPKKAGAFGRALVAKGFDSTTKRIGEKVHRAYKGLVLQDSIAVGQG